MTTPEDLRWWLGLDQRLDWTFAKTYAETAPHEYVVLGRTDGICAEDFVRAARVIHTFGQPGKFWNNTNIYLTNDRMKWWTMDSELVETGLINRATTDKVYGPQNAPVTHSDEFTKFDELATVYDSIRDSSGDLAVRQRIVEHFGDHAPTTLDVGCGTGALLDMGLISPKAYTGIDPSQAMLNALVRKHTSVGRVIPKRFEDVTDLDQSYELVVAMDVPGLDRDRLQRLCSGLLITL